MTCRNGVSNTRARDMRAGRRPGGSAAGNEPIPHGGIRESLLDRLAGALAAVLSFPGPTAPGRSLGSLLRHGRARERPTIPVAAGSSRPPPWFPPTRDAGRAPGRPYHTIPPEQPGRQDRMDTRQVWRAALGELQVSLSPAN